MMKNMPLMIAAICLYSAYFATAQITLDTNFESGSLDLQSSRVDGTSVMLRGVETWTMHPDFYRWFYFRASQVRGVRPMFQIGQGGGGPARNEFQGELTHSFFYSYDQRNWFTFDNASGVETDYRFSNDAPFTYDEVFIAYSVPYPVSRTIAKVTEWASSPFVSPTASSVTDFAIGRIPNTTPYGPTKLDLYGLKITDAEAERPKTKVGLAAGNHSGEPSGNWTLEGMIEFILSDDPRANLLRLNTEFLVYPQLDPLGRIEGFSRGNSQNAFNDHNRFWDAPITGNNGGFVEIDLINAAMATDLNGETDYFFDFHGFFGPPGLPHFIYADSKGVNSQFIRSLLTLETEMNVWEDNNTTPAGILEFWVKTEDAFRAEYSFTPESPPDYQIEDYLSLGRNYGIALYETVVPDLAPQDGDIDGNGMLTIADLELLMAAIRGELRDARFDLDQDSIASSADLSIWVNDLKNTWFGDANLDGEFNTGDLVNVFQAGQYEDNVDQNSTWSTGDWNGDAEFDTGDLVFAFQDGGFERGPRIATNTVPEPSSIVLLLLGLLAFATRRCA